MLSVSRSSRTRSSLEEMLEALRRRDELERPNDMPPELPARPRPTAKTRPPSSFKRRLPTSFETAEGEQENSADCNSEKEAVKGSSFGAKKVKEMEPIETSEWLWDLPANPDILDGVDDLVQLSYPNEPSILHNLQQRYSHERIYTKAGPVLIAANPFKDVKLHGNELITGYRQKLVDGPHVFSIAAAAYTEMMEDGITQSIILSGDSGSGKTETAKVAMQYLAELGGTSNGVESQVLQTSCILEAFGNAKTSRNNNSSRFGKLMDFHFSETGKLCSAKIQTLLLEQSRVVQLAHGERSYHIFYQLCAGAPADLRDKLKLKGAPEYNYLNQSDCLVINDVDDAEKFHMLVEALDTVNICKKDQEHAFEILAAVLWLGNISFEVIDNESHVGAVADEAVSNAASLIGCSAHALMLALSTSCAPPVNDKAGKWLTMQQAIDTRNALAMFIYGSLFNWLVEEINRSLAMGKPHTGRSISILDLYGFEAFKNNSFEQFCINYANERLKQLFNRHLFKLEQEEYELDGIDWTRVEFEDNQECLDLFENKSTGIISLLDEESNLHRATDFTFVSKLKQHLAGNLCFKGERGEAFSVQHYAGEVLYGTSGFLEKNKVMLLANIFQLLSSSSSELPRLFASLFDQSQKQSVTTKFKDHLFKLMQHLESTKPHFICCIKPNNKKLPGEFDKDVVLEQLRSCGVLSVVKISKSSYPTRMTHLDFTRRYGFLVDNSLPRDPLSTSVAILQQFNILPGTYQVGYTKLYFRAGQIAALEEVRKRVLHGVIMLQSFVRGEIGRRQYNTSLVKSKEQIGSDQIDEHLVAVVKIQSAIRGCLARRRFSNLWSLKKSILEKCKAGRKISEVTFCQDLPLEVLPSVVEELQKKLFMAEATLGRKEKENAALKEQVKQFEAHWSIYDGKMRSMEEKWRLQIASLQASLVATKKSLCADNAVGSSQDIDGGFTAINHLVKEFEDRKQTFDEEAMAFIQVSPGKSLSANLEKELRRMKLQFEQWKKEYKVKLRAANIKVHKLGHSDTERSRRTWWGGRKNRKCQA